MRKFRVTIWRQFLRPVGSKRQSRALNSMFCYKLPERAPDSEPPPVAWPIVGCKGRHNISHIQMFCEQIYSPITPSLLPHCGVGQKVTQPSASDHITGLSLYILICRSAKVIKDITFFILRYMLYGCPLLFHLCLLCLLCHYLYQNDLR